MPTQRRMHLVAFLMTGPTCHHHGAWRHPESAVDDLLSPSRYEHIARVLEAGKFDSLFFADILGLYDLYDSRFDTMVGRGGQVCLLDPAVVLPMMARVTSRIGLGLTYSSTFNHPYQIARMLASLDHLSAGRVAWNVVASTSTLEARNFGNGQYARPRPALRPGRRGAGGMLRAVGQLGGRRAGAGQGQRHLRGPGQDPLRRLCRAMDPHARAADHAAQPAGAPRHHAGRQLRPGPRLRRAPGAR